MKRLLFRCDVSPAIGLGHLKRCLTLAGELKKQGAELFFAVRSEHYDWIPEIKSIAQECISLDWSVSPEGDARETAQLYQAHRADAAIIDHYRADEAYQKHLCAADVAWLQFDGMARCPLWADWVFNANPCADENVYRSLKQREHTQFLLGPEYALLRPEFSLQSKRVRDRVRKVLLTFGGGDDYGATLFCLRALQPMMDEFETIVLSGGTNPNLKAIQQWQESRRENVTLLIDHPHIARVMSEADAAVIAGGTTTFETAAMGLPSLIVQIAENQKVNAVAWQQHNVGVDLGPLKGLTHDRLREELNALRTDPSRLQAMSEAGQKLVDGSGAKRVAEKLLKFN